MFKEPELSDDMWATETAQGARCKTWLLWR